MSINKKYVIVFIMNEQNSKNSQNSTSKSLAFLTALCLFFSTIEFAIPKPFPFFRLGLANLPIILSFYILSPKNSILLILLKIFVQNLISGSLFSYTILFSIGGSLASGLIMLFLFHSLYKKIPNAISLIGITLAGSLFNCVVQLGISFLLIFHENTKFVAPFMLGLSFVTGLLLGVFAEYFTNNSKWFLQIKNQSLQIVLPREK